MMPLHRMLSLLVAASLQGSPAPPPEIESALQEWRVTMEGPTWQVILDEETLKGRTLFNGKALVAAPPTTDEGWFQRARAFLAQAHLVMGIDGGPHLENVRVRMLPLGMTGGTDKMAVRLTQAVQGVPVRGGDVSALFDLGGNLLCLDTDGLPELAGFNVEPTVSTTVAVTAATSAFLVDAEQQPLYVGAPTLVIAQRLVGTRRSGALAWEIEINGEDQAYRYRIQARGEPAVIEAESLTHYCYCQQQTANTVAGGVTSGPAPQGTPWWSYDRAANYTTEYLPHLHLWRSDLSLLAATRSSGTFRFGDSGPVVLRFEGPFVTVNGLAGTGLQFFDSYERVDLSLIPNVPSALFFGPPSRDPLVVAQANAFLRVNQMREWIRATSPEDDTFDNGAPYDLRPNRLPNMVGCPAAFTRTGNNQRVIWFTRARHDIYQCGWNSAFATIIWHEMGHWLNELYGRGNDKVSGFGEGVADVWAMYQADFPRLGADDDMNNPLQPARFGDNNNTFCFCGDCPPGGPDHPASECVDLLSSTDDHKSAAGNPIGCTSGRMRCHYGGEHGNGLPLMGALWRMRANLQATRGVELGGAAADALFLGWMSAFSTRQIRSVIPFQFAILDGDGVLTNAPHLAEIAAGFTAKGFPSPALPPLRALCY